LHAYRALAEIDVRPAQCNLFGRPEAGEEGGREVVDDLAVFPSARPSRIASTSGRVNGSGAGFCTGAFSIAAAGLLSIAPSRRANSNTPRSGIK
jgi:hypothetical protein